MEKNAYDYINKFVDIFCDEYCTQDVDFTILRAELNFKIVSNQNDFVIKQIIDRINTNDRLFYVKLPKLLNCTFIKREQLKDLLKCNGVTFIECDFEKVIKIVEEREVE